MTQTQTKSKTETETETETDREKDKERDRKRLRGGELGKQDSEVIIDAVQGVGQRQEPPWSICLDQT
jgi:hypothetical protein